jgi:hypothetical protein
MHKINECDTEGMTRMLKTRLMDFRMIERLITFV